MTDRPEDPQIDTELSAFFSAAKRVQPAPSETLMARVLDDALATQGAWATPSAQKARNRKSKPRVGLLRQLREALGGWPAFGGLAMAGVTGLAIGVAFPAGLADLTSATLDRSAGADAYLVDLMPELDFDIAMDFGPDGGPLN